MKHSEAFVRLVDEAKTRVKETNPEEVLHRINAKEDFFLVDVREDNEWEQGHIKGAMHIGRGVLERDIEKMIPDKAAPVVLYCGGGFRSALAADNIQKMGYTNVLSMDGGMRAWRERMYPQAVPQKQGSCS
jgi:rhodanese-related sulfurtransferase